MGHRVPFQADKAEFPTQILLRRECQRHQDTSLGNAHRQSTHYATAKGRQPLMELLWTCHHRQNVSIRQTTGLKLLYCCPVKLLQAK